MAFKVSRREYSECPRHKETLNVWENEWEIYPYLIIIYYIDMSEYYTVVNNVCNYYVSIKMNCFIKSNVVDEQERRMLNGMKTGLWQQRLRLPGAHWEAQKGDWSYRDSREGSYTSQKQHADTHILGMETRKWWLKSHQMQRNNCWLFWAEKLPRSHWRRQSTRLLTEFKLIWL